MNLSLFKRGWRQAWCSLMMACMVVGAWAQEPWPTKPIRLVVPFGPGAVQDVIARTFNAELGRVLDATVVVENRPGAGGTVGTGQVAKSTPDGNTLVMSAASHTLAGHLYPKLGYDPIKDFVGVSLLGYSGYVIAAPANLGVSNLADYVRLVKSKPGQMNYASAGNGSATHLGMASFLSKAGAEMQHIPFKATGDAVNEVLAGRVQGVTSATIGYKGYQHASCISVNQVVCHGIPGDKVLRDGDIVNVDVTPLLDGWHGDSSRMYLVGDVPLKARRLVDVTYECLMIGIEMAKPGARIGDIGAAIQKHAEGNRYGVVREFCGHGLGRLFHDAPEVVHAGRAGTGPELRPGMFFTIEPMINLGKAGVRMLEDGWTAVTRDRSLSAQFEHSIGITETGCEIFTTSPKGLHKPPY